MADNFNVNAVQTSPAPPDNPHPPNQDLGNQGAYDAEMAHGPQGVGPQGGPQQFQGGPQQFQGGPPPENEKSQPPTPQQALIAAIEADLLAKRAKAIANLNNYMLSPVGVGEHPDIVSETIKLVEEISSADGVLQTVRRITSQ